VVKKLLSLPTAGLSIGAILPKNLSRTKRMIDNSPCDLPTGIQGNKLFGKKDLQEYAD
jgi:hypothetical protein